MRYPSSSAQFAEMTIRIPLESENSEPESLHEARKLMREFGNGLGEGQAPHDGARQHDQYLYAHK